MASIRIGAVSFLNARPLTWALDRDPGRWWIRYDLPSRCATLLHAGDTDLGLIPSIEYMNGDYRLVPGVGIGSRGPIASVALYSAREPQEIRSIALDTSSRTSVALLRVLLATHFRIAPELRPHGPDLRAMTRACDAALLIGDPALEADHQALGLRKYDLGEEWTQMTGLPFIYACWTGRPGVLGGDDVAALRAAQAEGVAAVDAIAQEYAGLDEPRVARAAAYLRDNVKYGLGPDEEAGLRMFYRLAGELGIVPAGRDVRFYPS